MNRYFSYIIYLIAISLSGTAAYYSVFGLSKLFSQQATAVIIMASILEVSKLVTASYLHRFWSDIKIGLKTYLTSAVIVLMLITSLGIYGFLVSAYQESADSMSIIDKQVNLIELKKERFNSTLNDLKIEQSQLTNSISELASGLSNNTIQYKDSESGEIITTTSSATRRVLNEQLTDFKLQRDIISKKIEAVSDSITSHEIKILNIQASNDVAAELGPLRYVAKITNMDIDVIVNWFIMVFIFVFDPLAITLLIAAQTIHIKRTTIKNEPVQNNDHEDNLDNNTVIHDTTTDNLFNDFYSAPSGSNIPKIIT